MKFSSFSTLVALASIASALPTATTGSKLARSKSSTSASTTDGPMGYASTNGGTTGGEGGTTTTVSSYAEFTAAVTRSDDSALVVYVSGEITGSDKVRDSCD